MGHNISTMRVDTLSLDYPGIALDQREGPCLPLYQRTHRKFPGRQQDPIRFPQSQHTNHARACLAIKSKRHQEFHPS